MRIRGSLLAPAVAGVSSVLSVITAVVACVNSARVGHFAAGDEANAWLAGLSSGVVAFLILRDRPSHRLGHVFAAASGFAAVAAATGQLADLAFARQPPSGAANIVAWVAGWSWLPGFLLLFAGVPLLFPNGGLASPSWRWPARVALLCGVAAVVAAAGSAEIVAQVNPAAVHPFGSPGPDAVLLSVVVVGFAVTSAMGAAAIIAILLRMRRLGEPSRQQHAWFAAAVVMVLAVSWLPVPPLVDFLVNGLSIAAMGVGVIRYQLFDIELALTRTFVYVVLTGGVLAAYLASAAVLGEQVGPGAGPALVAALVAVALAGVRGRVQRGVDRALYGRREDPLPALVELGERTGQAVSTEQLLPTITDTVRHALRVPYAGIELAGEDPPGHASGVPVERMVRFPLVHAGEQVGTLLVGMREGDTELAPIDKRVLKAFAGHVAASVHDAGVTLELRRSRERIVLAREDERRRLRRDLHDGLGPALAGISLGLETASRAAARTDPRLADLLARIHEEATAAAAGVRHLVTDLRPLVLDSKGLIPALAQHADLITSRSNGNLSVTVEGPPLPELPAAVEVAAYRIAMEALTNTVRHADAHSCSVVVQLNGGLRLTLRDDGTGVPDSPPGMGLSSMRARAEELGGVCTVTFRRGEGTTVEALLPVETP